MAPHNHGNTRGPPGHPRHTNSRPPTLIVTPMHALAQIGRLTCLKRLQLAGNLLTQLPASIGNLQSLEGLWLGGNLLTVLPPGMCV